MKSFKKPTKEQVDAALPLLSSPQHEAYFFSRLENPYWIEPLRERRVFDHPIQAEEVKGGGVRYPRWPASQYLARMAAIEPKKAASIFADLDTNNPSVIDDMLQAALSMPVEVAETLVPAICRAAEAETLWIYLKDASDLCVKIANSGNVASARKLAKALFTPKLEKGQEEPSGRDKHWYRDGLAKVVPVLSVKDTRTFVQLLCDWLKEFVQAKCVDHESGSDYSYMWRPAIEHHEQNRDYDFASIMVDFTRSGFEHAIQKDKMSLDEAIQILNQYKYIVFGRMKVQLVNRFA